MNTYTRTERYSPNTVTVMFEKPRLAFFLHRDFCRLTSISIPPTLMQRQYNNNVYRLAAGTLDTTTKPDLLHQQLLSNSICTDY
jgi:hypothetical protein